MPTYTPMRNLVLPKGSDLAKIDDLNRNSEILDSITADPPEDLVDNGFFPKAFNQRRKVLTTAWQYCLDRWIGRSTGIGLAIDINGLHITGDLTANVYLYQKIRQASVDMLGRTYTLVICDGDGNIGCETITLPTTEPSAWKTFTSVYVGHAYASIIHTGSGTNGFCVTVGRTSSSTGEVVIRWVALYEGSYTLETRPAYRIERHAVNVAECLQYYHLYATAEARPDNGFDASPPMRVNGASKGTITIDGVTYYYLSADL